MSSDFVAFLAWYLSVAVFGVLALPLAFKFFRRLPDRGYTLAKPLGVLAVCYAFWCLGSLGMLRNDVPGLLCAAALVGAVGLVWLGRAGWAELRAWLRDQWATVVAVEILFLVAFAALTMVRAYNPAIDSTEKPMEFMFINSILRSPVFPPNDAWLSGHVISYYYFGYVMVAALIRLTGVDSAVGFNLGLALLFALTAVGSLGVVLNLVALTKEEGRRLKDEKLLPASFSLLSSFWPALLGPLLVLVVGNFYGPLALAHQNGLFNFDMPMPRYDVGDLGTGGQTPPRVTADPINVWTWLDLKQLPAPPPAPPTINWDLGNWFFAARVVHDRNLTGAETEAIDEMPAFSFVLGDMHPHVLALPFVILALALALEWLLWGMGGELTVEDNQAGHKAQGLSLMPYARFVWRHLDRLVFSALILGGLFFLNTWDFPIYGFLTVAALAVGCGLAWGWPTLLRRWYCVVLFAVSVGVLGVVLYLPYYLSAQSQVGGILPNLIYPTRFQQTLVMFGPVLIGVTLFSVWLTIKGRAVFDWRAALWTGGGMVALLVLPVFVVVAAVQVSVAFQVRTEFIAFLEQFIASLTRFDAVRRLIQLQTELLAFMDQFIAPLTRGEAVQLLIQRRLVDSLATLFPAALIGLTLGLGWGILRPASAPPAEVVAAPEGEKKRAWRKGRGSAPAAMPVSEWRSPALALALLMLLTGALLLLGPEWVYVRDNFGSRMNTMFKFYFQTWILWALVSAFGAWYIFRFAGPVMRWSTMVVLGLAVLGGLLYTFPALCSKTDRSLPLVCTPPVDRPPRSPSLDGMAFFAQFQPEDWAAIQWLRQNVTGAPVIAEAVGGAYHVEESRISMATGLPTVMGWTNHEGQWRGNYYLQVARREGDIQTLYQTADWKLAESILADYHIEYVYVGEQERQKYAPLSLAKFNQKMRKVYPPEAAADNVVIYQRLAAQP